MADIPPIDKGQVITARRLNDYGSGINELNRKAFSPPRQITDQVDPEVPIEEAAGPQNFIETGRITSEVQVFDQDDTNYALIDRIESITFTNSDGVTLTLQFAN